MKPYHFGCIFLLFLACSKSQVSGTNQKKTFSNISLFSSQTQEHNSIDGVMVKIGSGKEPVGNNELDGTNIPNILPPSPVLRVKNSIQLENAIKNCVGSDKIIVTDSMIKHKDKPEEENDSKRFLKDENYKSGDNIITKQVTLFNGSAANLRTGTYLDKPTFEYITAANTVANVAAANCGNNKNDNNCLCDTEDNALFMLKRCLTGFNNNDTLFTEQLSAFNKACQINSTEAIASLLASFAFLKLQ